MPRLAVLLVCFLFLLPCLQSAAAFKFQVAPRTEECLYESARPGDLVNIKFQVLEGGNQDIDIKITFKAKNSPNGVERLIMIGQRKKEEKYVFLADNEGEFKFCFSNLMSISTPKTINVATSVTIPRQTVQSDFFDPLEEVVQQLSGGVQMVRDEQSTFKQRDIVTSNLSEATNAQVLWFSLIELFALILAVAYQIYNIQTMFEVKHSL